MYSVGKIWNSWKLLDIRGRTPLQQVSHIFNRPFPTHFAVETVRYMTDCSVYCAPKNSGVVSGKNPDFTSSIATCASNDHFPRNIAFGWNKTRRIFYGQRTIGDAYPQPTIRQKTITPSGIQLRTFPAVSTTCWPLDYYSCV